MEINKNRVLNFIGVFFILVFIFHMVNKFIFYELYEFFWLCNHVPLVVGIAILFRKQSIIIGEFCLLGVASLLWDIDLISYFVKGESLLSNVGYLLHNELIYSLSIGLIHLSFIPLTLVAIFLIGKKAPRGWIYGAIHGIILIPFAFLFEDKANLNCILSPCLEAIPNFSLYPVVFILGYIFVIIFPLNKLLDLFLKKN